MALAYERAGQGPPVVFLPGLALDRGVWAGVARGLADEFDTIRLDLRGHGESPEPTQPFAHHEDVVQALDALGIARAHFVGLSMGGAVALDVALAFPDRVRSLALVGSALHGHAWSAEWVASFRAVRRIGREQGARAARDAWAEQFGGVGRELFARDRGTRWTRRNLGRPLEPPAAERLAAVRVPTLVVVGERDRADFQAIARTLAAQIAGAQAVTLSGVGHLSPLEAPALLADTLKEFLHRVPS